MSSSRSLLEALLIAVALATAPDTLAQDAPLEAFLFASCPSEPPPKQQVAAVPVAALILEPLLSQLISGTIDMAGAYLTSAATTKSARMSATLEHDFYKLDASGGVSTRESNCLVLISPGSSNLMPPWLVQAKSRADELRPQSASPRFYFEAKVSVDETPGVSRLNITPNFLHVGEFLADGWSYRNIRKYSVAGTFRNRQSGEVFGSFKFDFENLRPSTWARTKTIGKDLTDESITPRLAEISAPAQVPFYPIAGAVAAAALKQQQVAAPYLEANELLDDKKPAAPVRRLPEWEVRSKPNGGSSAEAKMYQAALEALCQTIDSINAKAKKGSASLADARCPVTRLAYANEVEEARTKLDRKLASNWAISFHEFHLTDKPATCSRSGDIRKCQPPAPKQPTLGPYAIEVAVVETREPTEFAKALAATFSANKDKYKAAIEERVLPSRREATEQAAEAAAQSAIVAFELAKLKVDEAEAKLQEATNQPRSVQILLRAEVLKARVAANAAAKAAAKEPPYEY